jgi:hypothetical protein
MPKSIRQGREHGDDEFWVVERIHAERSKAVLVGAGATALRTQPPEEACEFTWDDVLFSAAYFDRQPDGSFSQPLGRWSDWLFPHLRNGRLWRQKDIDDIEILRGLAAEGRADGQTSAT